MQPSSVGLKVFFSGCGFEFLWFFSRQVRPMPKNPWLPDLLCKHWITSSVWNFCCWVTDVPPHETSHSSDEQGETTAIRRLQKINDVSFWYNYATFNCLWSNWNSCLIFKCTDKIHKFLLLYFSVHNNILFYFFLSLRAGGILQILQSDWFRERVVFHNLTH